MAHSNGHREPVLPPLDGPSTLYLDLLKGLLTRTRFPEKYRPIFPRGPARRVVYFTFRRLLNPFGLELVRKACFDAERRAEGMDWPPEAETMIGLHRLDNLQACVLDVLRREVPGDLVEAGVWRGGASIFMRAILQVCGDTERTVWLADSFEGLPKPNAEKYPADRGDTLWTARQVLGISLEEVKSNFERYGMLDSQVRFLKGWFRDTLPDAPISRIAVLRADGDMYESTMDTLTALYPKVSPGGYVIVDDYLCVPACKQAVEDYRSKIGITEPIIPIDRGGVFWQRRLTPP